MKHIFRKSVLSGIAVASCFYGISLSYATEWNVSLWGKRRAFTEHVEKLAELVSAKSNGEFTLNISYGGLSKPRENLDGISIGAFEMAQFCAGYHVDKNPSLSVLELPFLGVNGFEQEIAVSKAVYDHPATKADLARWSAMLLMPSPMPQYNVVGVGDAPTDLSGFDGMSVRATGGIGSALKSLGAVPTSMAATEVKQAMDSGVVKGVSFAPHAHLSFGTIEDARWWTKNLNPGTVNCPVVVNQDAFDALSTDEQAILLGSVDEALTHYVDFYNQKTMARWDQTLADKNIQIIEYPAAAIDALKAQVAGPAASAWIAENNNKGLPAQALYDLVIDTLK
ncbi:MAG: C4-dicarboxylate ABC transporter substrate-binding protein [Alphaproteobacteria bacterium]